MPSGDLDMKVRLAAFEHLAELFRIHGDVLPARVLRQGFEFQGQWVPLKGIQGIFKPAVLPELPLSITQLRKARRRRAGSTSRSPRDNDSTNDPSDYGC